MNTMMIRLLSAVSLAVVAILGADLSAATTTETSASAKADAKSDKKQDADKAKPSKKSKGKKAKKEAKPAAPVTIVEVDMAAVEKALGTATAIVDARGDAAGGIKGSVHVPANADDKDIKKALPSKDAEIIIYCGGPACPASKTLADRLVGIGYTNVKHYAGGIAEWKENNKPLNEEAKAVEADASAEPAAPAKS